MTAVWSLSIAALFGVTAVIGASEDELAIRSVLARATAAFNRHSANLTPEGYSDDFDAVNPAGGRVAGKPDLGEAFKTYLKNARKTETVQRVRFIRPDVALVDAEYEFTGTDIRPDPKGFETIVLVKQNDRWVITALRMMVSPVTAARQ
jgi:uncharacterized protein (TIGR02246 family)